MNVQPGQVVAQRYRLTRELGRGGVGAVWLAQQLARNAPCAIKFFIGPDADLAQYRQRFEIEANAAASLRHPNVVRVIEAGIWEGRPFIVMEYLEGECLDERLHRRKRLIPSEIIAFAKQIGQALSAAHAVGIVHRDLKPGNVFLAQDKAGRIVVKLIDFGIAKASTFSATPTPLTHTETIIGTPSYMSPEQIEGTRDLDGRSDLWSLAVIVFECLTGQLPFDSTTIGDLFAKIMIKPIPVPSHVAPGIPPSFDAWWARASAREPDKRFQSAVELCEALSRALIAGSSPNGDPTWWTATANVAPGGSRSHPTLSGQARPQLSADRSRSGLIAVAAVLGGVLVALAMVLVVILRRGPEPTSQVAGGPSSSAPALGGSAPQGPPSGASISPSAVVAASAEASARSASATPTTSGTSGVTPAAPSSSPRPSKPRVGPRPAATWGF